MSFSSYSPVGASLEDVLCGVHDTDLHEIDENDVRIYLEDDEDVACFSRTHSAARGS